MATTWLDFKELRERLDFAAVLQHFGVELKVKKGNQHQGFCPLPTHQGHKRSPSFSAQLDRKIWKCFGCGASGNVIDFGSRMMGLDPSDGPSLRKAALVLAEQFGITSVAPNDRKDGGTNGKKSAAQKKAERAVTRPAIVNPPLDFELQGLDYERPYLKERGFTGETIAHFGLGYCSRGIMQGRIVIPLHDPQAQLVGYAGRLVDDSKISDENPKYRFPGTRERQGKVVEFHKSLFLYGGFALSKVRDLVVVEGFPSVWWLWQHGYPDCVALMGSDCSEEQAKLIADTVLPEGRVWLLSDGDEAGARCAGSVLSQVAAQRWTRWVKLNENEQPTDCTGEELAALLSIGSSREGRSHAIA